LRVRSSPDGLTRARGTVVHRLVPGLDHEPVHVRVAQTGPDAVLFGVPAGDVGLLKLVGRMGAGSPYARAGVEEVRALFAPYGRWTGLASLVAMSAAGVKAPVPARTRWSGRRLRWAAA
jgi:hypothetical protein